MIPDFISSNIVGLEQRANDTFITNIDIFVRKSTP